MDNFESLFIRRGLTVKNAMKQMDITGRKILFVIDKENRLFGTITDGDIRRWILIDGDLNERVEKICNRTPICVKKDISKRELRKKILETGLGALPIIDSEGRIINIFFLNDLIKEELITGKKKADLNVPVVIMAGGQGNRLEPFTKILPKALIPICDKPAVQVIMDNFLQYISGDFYLVLGHKSEMIKSYFNTIAINYQINYLHEGIKPLGTVGGLQLIPKKFAQTFFLCNCDTIVKAKYDDIFTFHKQNEFDITIIGSMQHFMVPYGVMKINAGGELKEIEEKPEYSFLVNTGMYIIEKRVLQYIPKNRCFHIIDLIKRIKKNKHKIGVYPVSEKSWFDVGQWESYKETTRELSVIPGNEANGSVKRLRINE